MMMIMSDTKDEHGDGPDIIIGTRKSQLAMWQAEHVRDRLVEVFPRAKCRLLGVVSEGDRNQSIALSRFATKGIFTKELDVALFDKRIDIAVHSLKDLPTILPEGLRLAAVLKRGRVEDAVVLPPNTFYQSLHDLPAGSNIGTSSLRRRALLAKAHPELKCSVIRGNVNTRLARLDKGDYDAIILASVGLERVGLGDRISQVLDSKAFPYAVGQGALAVVCRTEDNAAFETLQRLHDPPTFLMCAAERSLLRTLEGGCKVPIGVWTSWDREQKVLELYGCVASLDGKVIIGNTRTVSVSNENEATELGAIVASFILDNGGREILQQVRADAETNTQIS